MNLKIEDFDFENREEDIDINQIKAEYEEKLKEISKQKFEEGYKKAVEEISKQKEEFYQNILKEKETQLINNYKSEIENIKQKCEEEKENLLKQIPIQIENLKKEYTKNITEIILNSLEEILNLLFIDPKNIEFLKEKILEIINDFEKEKVVKILVNKNLIKYFENFPYKVEETDIPEGDFIIKFDKFSIESSFKEKMESIKNELIRELKKHP